MSTLTAPEPTVLQAAALELADKLEAADRLALPYLRRYLEWLAGPKSQSGQPHCPPGLDPLFAKAVREVALDQATVQRRSLVGALPETMKARTR